MLTHYFKRHIIARGFAGYLRAIFNESFRNLIFVQFHGAALKEKESWELCCPGSCRWLISAFTSKFSYGLLKNDKIDFLWPSCHSGFEGGLLRWAVKNVSRWLSRLQTLSPCFYYSEKLEPCVSSTSNYVLAFWTSARSGFSETLCTEMMAKMQQEKMTF